MSVIKTLFEVCDLMSVSWRFSHLDSHVPLFVLEELKLGQLLLLLLRQTLTLGRTELRRDFLRHTEKSFPSDKVKKILVLITARRMTSSTLITASDLLEVQCTDQSNL